MVNNNNGLDSNSGDSSEWEDSKETGPIEKAKRAGANPKEGVKYRVTSSSIGRKLVPRGVNDPKFELLARVRNMLPVKRHFRK